MGIFDSILSKLFHHPAASGAEANQSPPAAAADTSAPTGGTPFDAGAALAAMASKKSEPLNYQTSIVDLLKVLDLDSSLDARKKLADELHVEAGGPGSPEQNMALQKAVMAKLAANGGKLPAGV